MSQQAVSSFRDKVNGSPELQQQIRAGTAAKTLDLVALGQSHGCEFTTAEVGALLGNAELSEFELEMVAGGGNDNAKILGHRPPTSHSHSH